MHQQNYTINLINDDIGVGCHLALGDSISIPERTGEGQAGNLYSIETGTILTSYVGTVRRTSQLKRINTSVNLLSEPHNAVTFGIKGDGPPLFSAPRIGAGYWDSLNANGYIAISAGHGAEDWQSVPAPAIITDWRVEINRAYDGTITVARY
jgi:hypothetical protein